MTHEPDNCYEPDEDDTYYPDEDDFAYMAAQEREVKSLRSEYHEAARELRDNQKYTDRQLRGLNKEKKTTARILSRRFYFDVADDSFEVEIADDVYDTIPWPYDEEGGEDESLSDGAPWPPTRKDKRKAKTEKRRATRHSRVWRTQWEKSRATSVVRKTGALVPAVAA